MKQLTPRHRRRLFSVLFCLIALACQGRGGVHEVPPASYPDDSSAPEFATPPDPMPPEPPSPETLSPGTEWPERPESEPIESESRETGPLPPERWTSEPSRAEQPGSRDEGHAEPPAAQGSTGGAATPPPTRQSPAEAKADRSAALGRGRDGNDAAASAPQHVDRDRPLMPRPVPERRPGLATHWGETRHSPAREVEFERSHGARPSATLELHYNDRTGARRMLPNGYWGHAEAHALGGLRVRIVDGEGRTFPALASGSRGIGVGAPGERYALEIENPTAERFEVVASVDGLDVLDGQDASFHKRGYLVGAYSSVVIDGFRRSDAEVAAFRLGDVARSYAASKGKARNVGVIGFAVFEERRRPVVYQPRVWRGPSTRDTELRQSADPFPGRYARPPVW